MTESPRLITLEESERLVHRILRFVPTPDLGTSITIRSWWNGELRWARNRVSLASDRRDLMISVGRVIDGSGGSAMTNQTDDASLEGVVRCAERSASFMNDRFKPAMPVLAPALPTVSSTIWSDATYNVTAEQRGQLGQSLTVNAESQGFLSAGYIEMRAGAVASFGTRSGKLPSVRYVKYSQSQCSTTVRHPQGIGSGWAGHSSYDWSSIDSGVLAARALEKCVASLNPVAIEPGRYTVILEPQAVCYVIESLVSSLNNRVSAEIGEGPFSLAYDKSLELWRTKLGLKIIDERISISHDPTDPLLGIITYPGLAATTWIEHGILKSLSYDRRSYALPRLNENLGDDARGSFRMSGGTTTVEEMITSTQRGLLVTRFHGVGMLDESSLLATGVTRDGLWLIERGKISKAVKNLRFTESPLFMLNRVEQLGVPVPVFRPISLPAIPGVSPAIVPALKASDFSFTSTVDAV